MVCRVCSWRAGGPLAGHLELNPPSQNGISMNRVQMFHLLKGTATRDRMITPLRIEVFIIVKFYLHNSVKYTKFCLKKR